MISTLLGMRVCRLPRQSGRLRAAQAHAVSALVEPRQGCYRCTRSLRCHSGARALAREPGIHNLGRLVSCTTFTSWRAGKHGTLYIGLTQRPGPSRVPAQDACRSRRIHVSIRDSSFLSGLNANDDVLNAIAREKELRSGAANGRSTSIRELQSGMGRPLARGSPS